MQSSKRPLDSALNLKSSKFPVSDLSSRKLKNSPKCKATTKNYPDRNFAETVRASTAFPIKRPENYDKFTNSAIKATSRVILTPDPISSHEKKHIRDKKLLGRPFFDPKKFLKKKLLKKVTQGTLMKSPSFKEMSESQIEQYFKDFTKKMKESSEREKIAWVERTHSRQKLIDNTNKVKVVQEEIEFKQEKMTVETVKKMSKSLLESSKRRNNLLESQQTKLACINKKNYNEWEKKYEKIQMVQTHRERKIIERSIKKQQKSKEISETIEKILKKNSKNEVYKTPENLNSQLKKFTTPISSSKN